MEWIEAKIKTVSDAVEMVTGLLMVNNIPNVRIIDDKEVDRFLLDHPLNWDYKEELPELSDETEIIFYVQGDDVGLEILSKIEISLQNLVLDIPEINFGNLTLTYGPVNDDEWLHEWKKTYKPFLIGKKTIVRPYWEEYKAKEGEVVFTIDPGAVFGTGLHATTQLCVLAMEGLPEIKDAKVLDIGCGSGILSIIAMLFGASSAVACDIDPSAARCAMENARLNNINASRFKVFTGNIFEEDFLPKESYNIVLANIVADVIMGLTPLVQGFMDENGIFIASGIIDERIADVKESITVNGLNIIKEYKMDGWYCVTAKAKHA